MRDFSKEVEENRNLENRIEVAKTLRDKSLKEMARDVYDILSEIYADSIKYVKYITPIFTKEDTDLWYKGLHSFFFRDDSHGHFIKVNEIEVYDDKKRVCYKNVAIDTDNEEKAYALDEGHKYSVESYLVKEFFKELDTILKIGKETLVGVAEYNIEEKLKSDKENLLKELNKVSCSVSK